METSRKPTRSIMPPASLFGGDAPAPTHFAKVAVERGIDAEKGQEGLTYAADAAVRAGDRVVVPLGRGDTPTGGIVIATGGAELLDGFDVSRVKPILEHQGASLTPGLVELARWIAGYYVCPLGMALSTMMPAAVKQGIGKTIERRYTFTPPEDGRELPARTRKSVDALAAAFGGLSGGMAGEKEGRESGEVIGVGEKELLAALSLRSVSALARLVRLGLLSVTRHEIVKSSGFEMPVLASAEPPPVLSPDQAMVVSGIEPRLGKFGVHLLRGVTGSGKTEVYLQLLARATAGGGTAIVLVPEISLTPQTSQRFVDRFGRDDAGAVAVLHSGLSASQRHAAWDRVRRGTARIVVGARSAIFAPVERLSLIVVDEEHDHSYKQDQLPRYHARDVAIKRGQIEGCPVILGSATPSLESWANATGTAPKFALWELPTRVTGVSMPEVRIVDLAAERRAIAVKDPSQANRLHAIGPTLEKEIDTTLKDGGQVILLLNRRGFAHYIACPDPKCGWVMRCENCDASMVLHRNVRTDSEAWMPPGGLVMCHHCLARQLLPRACPVCAKPTNPFGLGTQRLEDELVRKFAARHAMEAGAITRVDRDSMSSAADYFEILRAFSEGQIRIMLGTQMISKGLDFPNVRLVGVIDADTAMHLPDFRATERTFQLVSQVAGRAGRRDSRGTVIVQTMSPGHPAIQLAAKHDYRTFAEQELAIRARAGMPPATRMARIVTRDKDAGKARRRAEEVAAALREAVRAMSKAADGEAAVAVGPVAPCPIPRLHGQYRFGLEVVAAGAGAIQRALHAMRSRGLLTSDAHTAVDVDPVALL
ncbi:MAG: primosomal protein N' [Phycisphaerae bacterium]|nr:primosomal protein N' [Phycisphaerae bacterium]